MVQLPEGYAERFSYSRAMDGCRKRHTPPPARYLRLSGGNPPIDVVHKLVHDSTMSRVNIHEAKTHLSEHLDRLERGEEEVVVICRRNEPIAELRALRKRSAGPRPIFTPDPRFSLSEEFFEPLPDDLVAAFEGRDG